MEIAPFKIRVNSKQSKTVQKVLFKNGYDWRTNDKIIRNINAPFLYCYLRSDGSTYITHDFSEDLFSYHGTPEITYQSFITKYCFKYGR